MKAIVLGVVLGAALLLCAASRPSRVNALPRTGLASWYGENHRGRLMANGQRFNPDKLTAASWFYPLGTRVRVTSGSPARPGRSVVVTITDRGPARSLVRDGRIIDLTHGAFKRLAPPKKGLLPVTVQPIRSN